MNILKLDKQSSAISLPIYLRLSGGLGNQLFQIAAASKLSSHFSRTVNIYTNSLSAYATPRSLDCTKVLQLSLIDNAVLRSGNTFANLLNNLRIGRWIPILGINDKNFADALANCSRSVYPLFLDGYFMADWTQSSLKEAIDPFVAYPKNFTPSFFSTIGNAVKYATIHIRGSDFVGKQFNFCDTEYYQRALKIALSLGFSCFFVISDDQQYARKLLAPIEVTNKLVNFIFIETSSEVTQDFWTLSNSALRITGNSTFAFWSSFLGDLSSFTISCSSFTSAVPKPFKLPNEIWIS